MPDLKKEVESDIEDDNLEDYHNSDIESDIEDDNNLPTFKKDKVNIELDNDDNENDYIDDEDEDVMEKDEKKIITPFPAFTAEDLYIPSANVTNGLARMNLSGLTNSIPLPKPIDANIFSNSNNFKMDTSSGTAPNVIKKVVKRGNTVMNTYSFNHFYEEEDIQELLHLTASETDSNTNMDTANIFPKSVMVNNVPSEITDDYLMKLSEIDSSCGTLTSDDCIAGGIDDVGLYPVMHHDRSMSLDLKKTSNLLTNLEISSKNSKTLLNPWDSLSATGSPYIIAHKRSKTA